MNPIETEKMISDGKRAAKEQTASRIIGKSCEAMKRHEYLLRDRRMGKPPDR